MDNEEKNDLEEKKTEESDETSGSEQIEVDAETDVKEPRKGMLGLNFDHYLGGSGIAFSLGTLLMLVIAWSFQITGEDIPIPVILGINIIPTMIGSAVATFLFTRKSRINYVTDGIKIGLGGFIITFIYTSLLGQGVGGAYILTGFLLGGIIGGFITKKIYEKQL